MARTPVNKNSGHPGDELPSRAHGATGQPIAIVLTGSARLHAEKQQLDVSTYAGLLSPECQIGDIISVSPAGIQHDFVVLRRRWVIADAKRSLEITLDYPVRGR